MSDHPNADLLESITRKLETQQSPFWLSADEVRFLLDPEYPARERRRYSYTRTDIERFLALKVDKVKRRLTDG